MNTTKYISRLLAAVAVIFSTAVYSYGNNRVSAKSVLAIDSLELQDASGNIITNSTVKISTADPYKTIEFHFGVKNNTYAELMNLHVHREAIQTVKDSATSICSGDLCYPFWIYTTPDPVSLAPAATYSEFKLSYTPEGKSGTHIVKLEIFDSITDAEKPKYSFIRLEILVSPQAVAEDKMFFANPSPNPASGLTSIEYNIPGAHNNAEIYVRNVLGSLVMRKPVDVNDGKVNIDVSQWTAGVYFYSFVIDGKVAQSKRLIVKH